MLYRPVLKFMGSCASPFSASSVAGLQVLAPILASVISILCACLCVHVETGGQPSRLYDWISLFFNETGFLTVLELANLVMLAAQGPPETLLSLLLPQCWDCNALLVCLFVLMSESDPAYKASTLPTKIVSQPGSLEF